MLVFTPTSRFRVINCMLRQYVSVPTRVQLLHLDGPSRAFPMPLARLCLLLVFDTRDGLLLSDASF